MAINDIFNILNGVQGFNGKVAYHSFPVGNAPDLPFICFLTTDTNSFSADGINYYDANHYQIELYSKMKDITSESTIESTLKANGLFYTKGCIYLDDEKVYQTIYEIEV